ncbi:xanthine dehydrogenase family protein molybdopterin-binding subunit [Amycolatopsis lurida]
MNQAVGAPLSRVDGELKVTGRASFAADHHVDGIGYGVIVGSTVGRGRITGIDTRSALGQAGVLEVITHLNAPRLPYRPYRNFLVPQGERLHVLQDDQVRFFGQPIAVVVAETLEAAQHAASLVEVTYDAQQPILDLTGSPANQPITYARGDAEAGLGSAEVRLEMTYRAGRNHHNAMEPHATVASWDGDRLTVWDKTQYLVGAQGELAAVFDVPVQSVRVICPFIGGAFGNGLRSWPHAVVAALAARVTKRPVKVVLTRRQLFHGVGYRPAYEYRVRVGSDRRGRLSAMTHDMKFETSRYEMHMEGVATLGQMLYETPNVSQTFRNVPLDVNTPTWMRGPGYATAAYAIESAMDELAHQLRVDPVDLRLRNEPDDDPASGLPFSTRRLRECLTVGAREFGWRRRNPEPRSMTDGDRLIGMGVAAGAYHTLRSAAQAYARLTVEGIALIQAGASDMGPGTYTSMSQVAADALGMPMNTVRFELGDSTLPQVPPHGGSQTMASVGSAVQNACDQLRKQAITLAVADERSPLHGVDPDDVIVQGGRMRAKNNPVRGETYRELLTRLNRPHLEVIGSYAPPQQAQFSTYAYCATFAEVAVDVTLGLVRVRRMFGVYDAGRIINPKLADSQALGAMVGGIGMTLLEHTVTDHRDGRIVNAGLADYLVPVNADIPDLRAIYLEGNDAEADPIGVKGLGEVVMVGVAPAIANAVFHATGRRVRELPITAEALL